MYYVCSRNIFDLYRSAYDFLNLLEKSKSFCYIWCNHTPIPPKQVFDKDIGQDKRLGITKLPLIDLLAETEKEVELRLQPSLDMMKIKDKKDRGTLTIKVNISTYF